MSTVKFITNDNMIIEAESDAMNRASNLVENLIQRGLYVPGVTDEPIPLPMVRADTLNLVVDWVMYHKDIADDIDYRMEIMCDWDKEFFATSWDNIYAIMLAADSLAIPTLLRITYEIIADMVIKRANALGQGIVYWNENQGNGNGNGNGNSNSDGGDSAGSGPSDALNPIA